MIWVHLAGAPVRQFYADPRALGWLSAVHAAHALLRGTTPLRDDAEGETSSLSIELDNRGQRATVLLANPPLGAAVTVYDDDAAVFAGVVARVKVDEDVATLECVT